MAVAGETLYIKGEKNVEVTKHDVSLGDILAMECSNSDIVYKLKTISVFNVPQKGQKRFVISILRLIEIIHTVYPNVDVQNMGESDLIVTYENQKTPNQFMHWLKAAFILGITFFGSAFAIMSFDNDAGVSKLFKQIHELIMGYPPAGFTIMELTYCIGLIVGILVFFNHFGRKRFSVDPTPMEVEMRQYEEDIQKTLIEAASRKGKELDVH